MLAALLAVSLAANTSSTPKLAVLNFTTVKLSTDVGSFYAEHLGVKLEAVGFQVTTQKTIASILTLERQKQLLGCSDQSASCLVELGGALGVDAIVMGEVAAIGKSFQVNLRFLSSRDAKSTFTFSRLVKSEEDVIEALNDAAVEASRRFGAQRSQLVSSPEVVEHGGSMRPVQWSVIGVGAVATGVGAAFLISNADPWSKLHGPANADLPPAQADAMAKTAQNNQTVGLAVGLGGVAVAAGGVAWLLLSGSSDTTTVGVLPVSQGGVAVVSGTF